MSRNLLITMSIMAFVLVGTLLGFFFINRNSDSDIHDRVDAGEKNIVDLLKNNFDIVDFLEKTIYSSEDEIFVIYENSKIVFCVNKKIMLEDITIDKDNVYEQWLAYSTSKNEDFGNEVLPNWYYKVIFYT